MRRSSRPTKAAAPPGVALLVVDVQRAAVARRPLRVDEVLQNIAGLLAAARRVGAPIVHIQHGGAPGSDEEPRTPGWELHPTVRPTGREAVVGKRFNSAFRGTNLHADLQRQKVGTLVLVGIQTEYCVDTTCRVAFELGYRVVVPAWGHTTFDNGGLTATQIHTFYNERVFAGRFADVVPIEGAIARFGDADEAP